MAYIGKQPAAVALTSSDITDGIISTAKIADDAVTVAKTSYQDIPFRNIIINGDMSIAQRSASASSLTSSGYHAIDRFRCVIVTAGTWTISQSTTVPSGQGFAKSLKWDNTTADGSLGSGDFVSVQQFIEGQNLQHLKKGTSNAESLTVSFWVRSNKTGTYILELKDNDNTRAISQSYTISSADTWEKKTLTFAGDTTGTLDNDNAASFLVQFALAAGSNYTSGTLQTSWGSETTANRYVGQVNLADSTSNEWYMTGLQVEVGTSASDFEFLPVDVNLQRCQRYYYLHSGALPAGTSGTNKPLGTGHHYSATYLGLCLQFPTTMRAAPSTVSPNSSNYFVFYRDGGNDQFDTLAVEVVSPTGIQVFNGSQVSGTAGQAGAIRTNDASSYLAFESEL